MLGSLAIACCLAWSPPTGGNDTDDAPKLSRAGWYGTAGALMFAGSYGTTILVGAVKLDAAESKEEFGAYTSVVLPIIGPFVALGDHDRLLPRVGLAFAGATQIGGLSLMAASAVIGERDGPLPRIPAARKGIALGLLVTGSTTLGAIYLGTLSIAGSFARRDDPQERSFGRRLRFPLVGGFAAMPKAERYVQMWSAGLSSAVQISAAACIIAGLAWRRSARRPSLALLPTRDGMHVSLAMRF